MKIGIDISQTAYKGTGVARFTSGLIDYILETDKENEWTFLFYSLRQKVDSELENRIKKRGFRLIKIALPPSLVSLIWNVFHLFPLEWIVGDLDWFITSDWIEPKTIKVKKATIVHDLVFVRYPETVDKKILKTQSLRLKAVNKESKIIFADSETTKGDLIKLIGVDSKKIIVDYPGLKLDLPGQKKIAETIGKYKLGNRPYFLAVGKLEPRKNLSRLIDAFQQLDNPKIDLVIVGQKGWGDSLKRLSESKNKNIRLLGLVDDKELYSIYLKSLAFIFPSIWEGFGYPLVEAMALNVPVACSKIPPFEEIVQDNALYFNPLDTKDILRTLKTIIIQSENSKKLVKNGKIRTSFFSWENYYQKFIKTLYDYRD